MNCWEIKSAESHVSPFTLPALRSTLLVLLFAAGCAVGPNYHRPPLDVPAQYRSAPPILYTNSLGELPWWRVFKDDTLQGLIRTGLTNNYDLRIAIARVEQANAIVAQNRALYFPQLNYQGAVSRGRNALGTTLFPNNGQTANLVEVAGNASWELDLWGRLRRLNEAARAQYFAAQDARRGVYLATAAQVAQAYFELRELDALLDIARSTTRAFQETYDLFNRRFTGGAASALETARAEAAMASAASAVPDLERQIQAKENLLCYLVGRAPGPIPRGAGLESQALPPRIPAGLPSALLERRPDLRVAEQQLVAANAAVGVAQASYFPTVSLTGLLGGVAPNLDQLFGSGKEWSFGAGANGPTVQGLRLKDQKAVAVAQWEQARTRYQGAVTGAFGEVSSLLVAYQKLADVEARQAQAVAAYQEAVHLATLRYTAGLSSYMEVLEAQQQLFPAENSRSQTRLARLVTLVQLYKALGGGWNLQDPAAPGAWPKPPATGSPAPQ